MQYKQAFILGNPRSGTSLLRLMLNAHPRVAAPPECGFLQWWHDKYKTWTEKDALNPTSIQRYVNDLASSRKIETWELSWQRLIATIEKLRPSTYGELCNCVYIAWAEDRRVDVLIDKNNYYIHHLGTLQAVWPDAYYIHLIRDGRDVAVSYRDLKSLESSSQYKPSLAFDVEDIAREWSLNNSNIRTFLSRQPESRTISIRYEDLVRRPKKTLLEVLAPFGLSFTPDLVDAEQRTGEPKATLDWKRRVQSPLDASRIGRHKKKLSTEQIQAFERVAVDELKQYNYNLRT